MDVAVGPSRGEGGEQLQRSGVALEKEFGHAGCSSEVAVDLERGMYVPEIVGCAFFEQVLEQGVGMVAVVQACPVVEFPAHAPSGCLVAALAQSGLAGFGKFRIVEGVDGRSGMEAEEMVGMAMVVVRVVDILIPFLQLAVLSDFIRAYAGEFFFPFLHRLRVSVENTGRFNGVGKNLASYGVGIGGAAVASAVFGRIGGRNGILTVAEREKVGGEVCTGLYYGIAYLAKPLAVTGIIIVFPYLGGEHGPAEGL